MTFDITEIVEKSKAAFIELETQAIFASLVASNPFLAYPIISDIVKYFIRNVLSKTANGITLMAFFANTAIRKPKQAQEFIDAADYLENIPPNATDEEYLAAEQAKASAFRELIVLGN